MSNRFHNKFHRQNHHSDPTVGYPDSAYDPIASFEQPFKGEFYSQGDIITTQNLSAGINLTVSNDASILGNTVHTPNIGTGEDNSVVILNSLGRLKTDEINPQVWDTTAKYISASDGALTVNRLTKATNTIGINESIVFDDGTNVGIGTDVPEAKLTVSGALSTLGTATIGTITTGSTDSVVTESTGLLQKRNINPQIWDTTAKFVSASDGALSVNYLTKATNSNGINESIVFDNGTNVGIGEASPEGKLHVTAGSSGSVTAQPNSVGIFENSGNSYISVLSPNAQYAGLVMGGPGNPYGSYVSWNHDNNALKVATAHSGAGLQFLVNTEQEAIRVLSGGNVGIGTTSPGAKLTINGTLSTSGTATIGTIATNSTGTSFVVETDGLLQKRILNIGAVDTTAMFVSASDGALSVNYLTKATDSNGINESIISDNGSLVYVGGNMTISGNLTAMGNSYFANTLFTTTSAISVVNYGTGPAIYAFQGPGTQDIASFYDGDGVEVLHVGNCDPGQLFGKVGINESDPNKELTVRGSVSASGTLNVGTINTNTTSDSIVVLGANNVLEKRSVDSRAWGSSLVDGTGTTNYVAKWSDADTITNSHIFDNGTNVGIGTNSPVSKLDIQSSAINEPVLFLKPPSGSYGNRSILGMWSTFGTNPFGDATIRRTADIVAGYSTSTWGNEYLSFNVGNNGASNDAAVLTSEKVRITGSGNVGIGTDAPGVKLDVNGVVRSATNTVTPAVTTALPSSNDVILNNQTEPVTITAFSGGVEGATYTITNKSTHVVTLDTSASLFVRGGNSWVSHKCTTNAEGYIVLPQNFSCSLRMDSATTGSAW